MAISRYDKFRKVTDEIFEKPRLETFPTIKAEDLKDDVNDIIMTYDESMRFDKLAFDYLGDGRYWWAICLLNDAHLPFSSNLKPGDNIRIPTNISRILTIIQSKVKEK